MNSSRGFDILDVGGTLVSPTILCHHTLMKSSLSGSKTYAQHVMAPSTPAEFREAIKDKF